MMLIPKTMTPSQEKDARAKVFHLLKKYTSLTFLGHAVGLYRNFTNAYEKQLDTPRPNEKWYEEKYAGMFLPYLIELEQGLETLRKGVRKNTAYSVISAGDKFKDCLWGRAADHWGAEGDPFFIQLGLRHVGANEQQSDVYTDFVKPLLWTCDCLDALKCTVGLKFSRPLAFSMQKGARRWFSHWTYESMFQSAPPDWSDWPPARTYPVPIPPCPPKNEDDEGEILSGEEVQVDGIYEPWFFTGPVGCPNYLLKGSIAHQYQPEGSNDLDDVRWRLIWEDKRYIDGSIPSEEVTYVETPAQSKAATPVAVYAGDPCPQTGRWQAPRLKNRIELVEQGQPMPGPASTQTGTVIWYLMRPASEDSV